MSDGGIVRRAVSSQHKNDSNHKSESQQGVQKQSKTHYNKMEHVQLPRDFFPQLSLGLRLAFCTMGKRHEFHLIFRSHSILGYNIHVHFRVVTLSLSILHACLTRV
jgi:hypothetical protein